MVWCEALCVSYMAALMALVAYKHCTFEKRGLLKWSSLSWDHVACPSGHRGPSLLAVGRLLVSAYVLSTIYTMITGPVVHRGRIAVGGISVLSTFTVWCYSLLGLYFLAAGLVSAAASFGVKGESASLHFLSCALWVWFESMLACALLVTVIVWVVLLPSIYVATGTDGGLLSYLPISAHNLNSVFMLAEGLFNQLHLEPAHIVFVLYYGAMYVVFSWVWFLHSGIFWYFFIDWRSPWTLIGYSLLIGAIYSFFMVSRRLLARVKHLKVAERQVVCSGDMLQENPSERLGQLEPASVVTD